MKGVKTPFDMRQRMNLNTAGGTKLRSLSYPPSSPIFFLSFSGESCEERKKRREMTTCVGRWSRKKVGTFFAQLCDDFYCIIFWCWPRVQKWRASSPWKSQIIFLTCENIANEKEKWPKREREKIFLYSSHVRETRKKIIYLIGRWRMFWVLTLCVLHPCSWDNISIANVETGKILRSKRQLALNFEIVLHLQYKKINSSY